MSRLERLGTPGSYVKQISDQLWRIELPLPMRDLKSVNAYVIGAEDGVTLIDPGYASPESEDLLIEALYSIGFSVGDLQRILVTHIHWDHYAQAQRWQEQLGVRLSRSRGTPYHLRGFPGARDLFRAGETPYIPTRRNSCGLLAKAHWPTMCNALNSNHGNVI